MTENQEIITELIGEVQVSCDNLNSQIGFLRKNFIGKLQALRADMDTDEAMKQADKVNEGFKYIMGELEI